MPKIPTSNNTSGLGHVEVGNLRIGEQLQYHRDGGEFGAGIARAGSGLASLGNAMMEFAQKKQDAENDLAAAEYKAAWTKREQKLETKMSNNPGMVEEFGNWAQESDKEWVKESKAFTDRMTGDYRKRFLTEWEPVRTKAVGERLRISNRAAVKRIADDYTSVIQELCQSGMYDDAYLEAEVAYADGVFTPEQVEDITKRYIPQMEDFNAVNALVENAPAKALEELKNQNNYKNLTTEQRTNFLRSAGRRDAEKRLAENERLEERLLNGEAVSVDEVKKNFEGRNSAGDIQQKNQQIKMVQSFSARRDTAKERLEAANRKRLFEQTGYDLIKTEFSPNIEDAAKEYAQKRNKILELFSNRASEVKTLVSYLNESYNSHLNNLKKGTKKPTYRESYVYTWGEGYIDNIKKEDIGYDGFLWNNDYSKPTVESNRKTLTVLFEDFMIQNPTATQAEAEKFIEDTRKEINHTKVENMVNFVEQFRKRRRPQSYRTPENEAETAAELKNTGNVEIRTTEQGDTEVFDAASHANLKSTVRLKK